MDLDKIKEGLKVVYKQSSYMPETLSAEYKKLHDKYLGQVGEILPDDKQILDKEKEILLQVKFSNGVILELAPEEVEIYYN